MSLNLLFTSYILSFYVIVEVFPPIIALGSLLTADKSLQKGQE